MVGKNICLTHKNTALLSIFHFIQPSSSTHPSNEPSIRSQTSPPLPLPLTHPTSFTLTTSKLYRSTTHFLLSGFALYPIKRSSSWLQSDLNARSSTVAYFFNWIPHFLGGSKRRRNNCYRYSSAKGLPWYQQVYSR